MSTQLTNLDTPPVKANPQPLSVIIRGVMVLVMGIVLLSRNEYTSIIPVVMLIGALGIGIGSRQSVFLYLFLTLVFAFQFRIFDIGLYVNRATELGWDEVKFSAATLLFLATSFRYLESSRFHTAYPASERGANRDLGRTIGAILRGRWLLIPGATAIAFAGLYMGRFSLSQGFQVGIHGTIGRLIALVFVLFSAWVVCGAWLAVLRRRKMSRVESKVSFRSMFAREFWWDHSGLEKRLVKNRRRVENRQRVAEE